MGRRTARRTEGCWERREAVRGVRLVDGGGFGVGVVDVDVVVVVEMRRSGVLRERRDEDAAAEEGGAKEVVDAEVRAG